MGKCVVCGNDYDKSFQVIMDDSEYTFDSFECAEHDLAPVCENCGVKELVMELKQMEKYSAVLTVLKLQVLKN
jgi:hypothetical protein